MNVKLVQEQFFQEIKNRLPTDASLAEEIARLLKVSTDSAYRRMRGEKQITLEELAALATRFSVSVDQLLNIQTGNIVFQGNFLNPKTYRYSDYLTSMMHQLAYFNSFHKKEFYYLCKDTPIFYYFISKDLAAFKYFFWMGTLIYFPEFRNKKVVLDEYPPELEQLGNKIYELYTQLDSVEIWNIESWNTTFHQIDYYLESGMFQSYEDVLKIYAGMEYVIDHLEEQARMGVKFVAGHPEVKPGGKFNMYFNEIVIQDNNMMALLDHSRISFVPHTAINYMMTRDIAYSENFYQYVQNLIKRSTLISEVSEKERVRFFHRMRERIARRKEMLKE